MNSIIIEELQEERDDLVSSLSAWRQKQIKSEEACGKYIVEHDWVEVASNFGLVKPFEFVLCRVICAGEDNVKTVWSTQKLADVAKLNNELLQQCGRIYFSEDRGIAEYINLAEKLGKLTLVIRWEYDEEYADVWGENIISQPLEYVQLVSRPYVPPFEQPKPKPAKKKMVQEKDLEQDLLHWMHSMGIDAENQVLTIKHRMDLWVPGKCFIELKRGKVTGDDVCQAIDYCAEYQLPVVLVGNHIGTMASRGIEAFNKAVDSDMVTFVQWSAVKTYLKGLLSLKN
jgi:hypothetical protein